MIIVKIVVSFCNLFNFIYFDSRLIKELLYARIRLENDNAMFKVHDLLVFNYLLLIVINPTTNMTPCNSILTIESNIKILQNDSKLTIR